MYPYYNNFGWFGILGLADIIRLAIFILIVVLIFRWIGGHHHWHGHDHDVTPLDILKERYAKGDITKKEYEDMKRDLND